MAAVDPVLRNEQSLEQIYRHGTRVLAVGAYAAVVVASYLLLAPVLRGEAPAAPALPSAPTLTYTVQQGDTVETVAALNALSLAELFALNPGLEPLRLEPKVTVRVG